MAGLKQLKRVSWAPDVKLCQVRLFLSEDAPAQSGLGTQDNLQAKTSWMMHASGIGVDDSLPPGFEAPHPAYCIGVDISKIPVVKWKNPCRIILDPEWRVVAGEESEEVPVQVQRELIILEHFYPHQSSIPLNPFVPPEVQDSKCDDAQTPPIPILPIEDEDTSDPFEASVSVSSSVQNQQPNSQQIPTRLNTVHAPDAKYLQSNAARPAFGVSNVDAAAAGVLHAAEPDVVAAASAAYTAIIRTSEEGSMIDKDLLINILKNPSLVEKLLTECGPAKQTQSLSAPIPVARPHALQLIPPPPPSQINASPSQQASTTRPPLMYKLPNVVPPIGTNSQPPPAMQIPITHPSAAPVKDINYFKSLIQQHGGDKQTVDANPHSVNYQNFGSANSVDMMSKGIIKQHTEMKPRIQKPCAFFNTPRGCRHGASCLFIHDASAAPRVEHSKGSKKIKLDGETTGRN